MKLQPVSAMDEVPEIDPHVHAELPASLVADFFRDVAAIGETLTVGACEERFTMQVKTNYETFAAEFDADADVFASTDGRYAYGAAVDPGRVKPDPNPAPPFLEHEFDCGWLAKCAKGFSIAKTVVFSLRAEKCPLRLRGMMEGVSSVDYYLAPKSPAED
eukprot:GHVU01173035.1.p2 GENE.GHVU01173035.1~~GHVU01173035.1.p2  ORF type:complete len:160 (+),score=28.42 GHVU01173035.1:1677-2156(+)